MTYWDVHIKTGLLKFDDLHHKNEQKSAGKLCKKDTVSLDEQILSLPVVTIYSILHFSGVITVTIHSFSNALC